MVDMKVTLYYEYFEDISVGSAAECAHNAAQLTYIPVQANYKRPAAHAAPRI